MAENDSEKEHSGGDKNEEHEEQIDKLREEIAVLSKILQETFLNGYLDVLSDKRKLFTLNFFIGLTRGVGMAIGFTLLGAIVFFILQKLILLNLPVISDFIADLIKLVNEQGLQ